MGAKPLFLVAALLAVAGCSGGLSRLAPPGIVKYEDRAKGEPVDAAILARIEQQRSLKGGGFPNLSQQPTKLPEGIAAPERAAMAEELIARRDLLAASVKEDRALADAERERRLEEDRDALSNAVTRDDAAARRERGLKPRPNPDAQD